MIRKILNLLAGFDRYLYIVFIGLVVIYSINFIGVEIFLLKAQLTYLFATSINYVIAYFGNARAFGQDVNKNNLKKFILNSLIFLIINNFLFHIFVTYFRIHYLLAITINFVIFPIAKFLSYKYLVFKENG